MKRGFVGSRAIIIIGVLFAGCASPSTPAKPATAPPPTSASACEEAFEDLVRYFGADPERKRPATLREDTFLPACQELPTAAQRCMLFSFMQSHATQCDETMSHVPPELMHRIAAMVGK
jgi:hypothetical protein